jgi:hypothetical protein
MGSYRYRQPKIIKSFITITIFIGSRPVKEDPSGLNLPTRTPAVTTIAWKNW